MNQMQERKRSMYYVVEDYLATVPAATIASMPEFEAKFTVFMNVVDKIRTQSESQTTNRIGYRMVKDDLKLDMTKKAIDVASRVKAYAINTNDVVLREEMYQRISNLYKRPDTVCADICQFIYNKGQLLLTALAAYGVTNELLDALNDSIGAYTSYIPKPRAGIVERKQATEEMMRLFKASDATLSSLDALITMLQFTDKEVYDAYFSSRKIIRPSYRTIALKGIITDAEGLPLSKVDVRVDGTSIIRKTSSRGGFEIKDLDSGTYTVVLQKAGYAATTTEVAITATERTVVTVVMEPEGGTDKDVA
ncbi:carboxypeptidase-like regulatory domain-containing protein [Flavobacterium sp. XGLA_31]|uniref:carboxypeptidase-like regulatory domain-containing protein n=1 Tax=Flavobacterium sp. XGLA_31 TaxID=3447666 RepID=UPI003F3C9B9B